MNRKQAVIICLILACSLAVAVYAEDAVVYPTLPGSSLRHYS